MATRLLMAILLRAASLAQAGKSPQRVKRRSARQPTWRVGANFHSSRSGAYRSLKEGNSTPAKGRIMAEPVGAIGAASAAKFAVAVTRKQLDQQDLQGQQAVQLIQSASSPELATSGAVGTKLNLVG